MSRSRSFSLIPLTKSSSHADALATAPPELPQKRPTPPGYSVTTTITSGGHPLPTKPPPASSSKCHDHRKSYPASEALFQLVFRIIALLLHAAVLVITWILTRDKSLHNFHNTKIQYSLIGYTMALTAVEILALANPHIPFLNASRGRRFPRLPSFYLALAETVALASIVCTGIILLNEHGADERRPLDCPVMTCVSDWDRIGVYGYMLEMVAGLVHVAFWFGALWHWGRQYIQF